MMRNAIAIVVTTLVLGACGKGEQAGIEAAKREQEAEMAAARAQQLPTNTKRIKPAVPTDVHIPCDELIDLAGFTAALGEKDPLTLKDLTSNNKDSTASCSLVRGG